MTYGRISPGEAPKHGQHDHHISKLVGHKRPVRPVHWPHARLRRSILFLHPRCMYIRSSVVSTGRSSDRSAPRGVTRPADVTGVPRDDVFAAGSRQKSWILCRLINILHDRPWSSGHWRWMWGRYKRYLVGFWFWVKIAFGYFTKFIFGQVLRLLINANIYVPTSSYKKEKVVMFVSYANHHQISCGKLDFPQENIRNQRFFPRVIGTPSYR